MQERTKEVRFDIYCKSCEHWTTSASNDPCNDCLGQPSNGDSHVPVYYKKAGPVINYIIPASIQVISRNFESNGTDTPEIVYDYTRDRLKTEKWADHEPTKDELHKLFEIKGEDYYEVINLG